MNKIIEKIIAWLSHWDKDKVLHFSLCMIVSIIAACIVKICKGDTWSIIAAAFFAGFVTGIGKEIYDEWKYGDSDSSDWAADAIGTIIGTILTAILIV